MKAPYTWKQHMSSGPDRCAAALVVFTYSYHEGRSQKAVEKPFESAHEGTAAFLMEMLRVMSTDTA